MMFRLALVVATLVIGCGREPRPIPLLAVPDDPFETAVSAFEPRGVQCDWIRVAPDMPGTTVIFTFDDPCLDSGIEPDVRWGRDGRTAIVIRSVHGRKRTSLADFERKEMRALPYAAAAGFSWESVPRQVDLTHPNWFDQLKKKLQVGNTCTTPKERVLEWNGAGWRAVDGAVGGCNDPSISVHDWIAPPRSSASESDVHGLVVGPPAEFARRGEGVLWQSATAVSVTYWGSQ